jgi:hypothetical protein
MRFIEVTQANYRKIFNLAHVRTVEETWPRGSGALIDGTEVDQSYETVLGMIQNETTVDGAWLRCPNTNVAGMQ